MNTHELAKELDALARALRGLSSEASTVISAQLKLDSFRDVAAAAQKLKVADISRALVLRSVPAVRAVQMRQDVFDRRIEKLAPVCADRICADVAARKTAPEGHNMRFTYRAVGPGEIAYYDECRSFDRTALNAECFAWHRSLRYALARLIPAYGYHELERAADRAAGVTTQPNWSQLDQATKDAHLNRTCRASRLREEYAAKLDRWCDETSVLRYSRDSLNRVDKFLGIDPAPFIKLVDAVKAGDPDPLQIFSRSALPATSAA